MTRRVRLPRFSLRTLFVLTTIVAIGCYWLMLPSMRASQFVKAVGAGDIQAADEMFLDAGDRLLFDWNEKHWRFKAQAELQPYTFRDALRGERRITLRVLFGDAGPMRGVNWFVTATRAGLREPEPTWGGGGGGGGGIL